MAHWGGGRGGMNIYIYIFFCDNLLSYPVPGHSWPIGEGGGGVHTHCTSPSTGLKGNLLLLRKYFERFSLYSLSI